MDAPLIASANAAPIGTSTFGRLIQERRVPRRVTLESLWQRAVHHGGQTLVSLPPSMWLLVDVSVLTTGFHLAYKVFPPIDTITTPHIGLWQAVGVFALVVAVSSLVFGLNERETLQSRSRIATRMLLTTGSVTAVAYAIIYVALYATISRRATAMAMSILLVSGMVARLSAWWVIHRVRRGLLVIGSRTLYDSFAQAQENGCLPEYRLVGYASVGTEPNDRSGDACHLGPIVEQVAHLRKSSVTDVVVSDQAARDPRVMDWMVPCLQRGCRVTNEAIFYEKATGQILVDEITPQWFLFADLQVNRDQHAALKRVIDIITASIGVALSAPLWPILALAVKLCDGGPVFYSQDRVGQNGQIFKLYKFRTMRTDAENGKSLWASPNDPRVTPVGRLLRKMRLDELPQFYNVLVGQMSIVGPRPERPDIVRELCDKVPYYAERHLVKPGITGWAQISFRYGSSIADAKRKLQFDLYYLKHMSFELDAIILFRTVGTFLKGGC